MPRYADIVAWRGSMRMHLLVGVLACVTTLSHDLSRAIRMTQCLVIQATHVCVRRLLESGWGKTRIQQASSASAHNWGCNPIQAGKQHPR